MNPAVRCRDLTRRDPLALAARSRADEILAKPTTPRPSAFRIINIASRADCLPGYVSDRSTLSIHGKSSRSARA